MRETFKQEKIGGRDVDIYLPPSYRQGEGTYALQINNIGTTTASGYGSINN